MQYVLWTLVSIVAYIGGIIIFMRVTPRLASVNFDEFLFVGVAALDILGALLAFGAVVITFALFNGAIVVRVFDFFLLLGIFLAALRIALYAIRPRQGTFRVSRIMAGSFGFFLAVAAVYCVVLLFVS